MNTRNTGLIFVGVLLILFGLMSLISIWIDVDWFGLFCPSVLIILGIWMLLKPGQISFIGDANISFIGEIKRSGSWQPSGESFLAFIGDLDLNLVHAELSSGETHYSFTGFITDVDMSLPADVGLRISALGFISELKIQDQKQESFIAPLNWFSSDYETAERKVCLDMVGFVNEIKVHQV